MKVAIETRGPVDEPYLKLHQEHLLGVTLRPGSMGIGVRRSALRRITFDAGLMGLCPPQSEYWIGTSDMTHVTMTISDEALMAASDGAGSRIELRLERELVDNCARSPRQWTWKELRASQAGAFSSTRSSRHLLGLWSSVMPYATMACGFIAAD